MGRLSRKIYPNGSNVQFFYNPRGQKERVISPLGERKYYYDIMGRLIREEKEDGQFIAYKYDLAGNLIETTFSGGHWVQYKYDSLNRLIAVISDDGITRYEYDKVGNRIRMVYPNGTETIYQYDKLNHINQFYFSLQDFYAGFLAVKIIYPRYLKYPKKAVLGGSEFFKNFLNSFERKSKERSFAHP